MSQSVKHPTVDFDSGHFRVVRLNPTQVKILSSDSLSPSAPSTLSFKMHTYIQTNTNINEMLCCNNKIITNQYNENGK